MLNKLPSYFHNIWKYIWYHPGAFSREEKYENAINFPNVDIMLCDGILEFETNYFRNASDWTNAIKTSRWRRAFYGNDKYYPIISIASLEYCINCHRGVEYFPIQTWSYHFFRQFILWKQINHKIYFKFDKLVMITKVLPLKNIWTFCRTHT